MRKIVYIGNNLSKKTKYTPMLVTLCALFAKDGFTVVIASSYMNKFRRLLDMVKTVIQHRRTTSYVLIDTFGAFNFYFAVLISQIARICRVPYIPILRGGNLPDRFKNNPFFTKLLFQNSYENVCPSNFLKVELEKVGQKAVVIPNILNIANYQFNKRSVFEPKILYVRAFHQIYNPTMAVRVLHQVQQQYPKATLCMIGPPKDSSFEETKVLATKLGLSDSITYTGVLPKKEWHALAENYDIFINTTNVDNTPVSVMEGMAMGLPVVTTNVGGIPYLLTNGVDAYLVPPNDAVAMSERILAIVENSTNVDEIVTNARKKVEQFDWSVVRNQWIDLLSVTASIPQQKWKDRVYLNSPVFMQNLLMSIYGVYWKNRRLGGKFQEYIMEFKERESYTQQEWLEYQTREFRKLLVHAYTTVPFYKNLYTKHGFTLKDFEQFELHQLKTLPYLEKDDLRRFGKTTLLSTKKKKGAFFASSGSTGTPTSIYISKEFHQKWNAVYELRVRNWAGVNSKLARGMIGGRRIVNSSNPKPPYYRYNLTEKQTYFSAYFINKDTAPNYLKGMYKNKVEYMVGYAMSTYFLADVILKNGLKAPKLKAVLTSSEILTDQMRTTIAETFQCKVYDAYSGVEACGLISENTAGDFLFSPDTGIQEVLDANGNATPLGEVGEVVATGLLNYDQPLIRYRIGDRVRMSQDQETNSGLQMPKVASIEGRVEDVIVGLDGSKMVRFHGLFIDIPHLIVGQVVQETIKEVTINLVVEVGFDKANEVLISQRLRSQLGAVKISYTYLKEIPKNKNGKFQAVISKLQN